MNWTKLIVAIAATAFASCLLMGNGALSDEETKRRIADFVILPSRLCGHALGDFRDEFRRRKLTNRVWFDASRSQNFPPCACAEFLVIYMQQWEKDCQEIA